MTEKRKVILLRHAKTVLNQRKCITGQLDVEIAENVVVDEIYNFGGMIYTSPLKRCRQTLEKICPDLATVAIKDARLIERNMGIFEGEKREAIKWKFPEYFECGKFNVFKTPPGGETYEDLYGRLYSFYLERIVRVEENVLICGHNHALKVLKAILLQEEITMDYWIRNNFENGEVYEYYI